MATTASDSSTSMHMSLFEMMQKGVDPSSKKVKCIVEDYYKSNFGKEEENESEEEAGLMDYRLNEITAVDKDRHITIILEFSFDKNDECDLSVPDNFEERWCASYDAKEIAEEAIGEEYTILDAFWSGNKLQIIIDNLDEYYNSDEIIADLEFNSLEDGPYEAEPGTGFWVISYNDIEQAAANT